MNTSAPALHSSEQLLLLLVDDEGKRDRWISLADAALRAAALADLAVAGSVTLSADKQAKVSPASDPAALGATSLAPLAEALAGKTNRHGWIRAYRVVSGYWFDAWGVAADSLAARGMVTSERSTLLGFQRTKITIKDHAPERELRARLAGVLRGEAVPEPEDIITLNILKQMNAAKRVIGVDVPKLKRRDINKRIDAATRAFKASQPDSRASAASRGAGPTGQNAEVTEATIRALQAVQMLYIAAVS